MAVHQQIQFPNWFTVVWIGWTGMGSTSPHYCHFIVGWFGWSSLFYWEKQGWTTGVSVLHVLPSGSAPQWNETVLQWELGNSSFRMTTATAAPLKMRRLSYLPKSEDNVLLQLSSSTSGEHRGHKVYIGNASICMLTSFFSGRTKWSYWHLERQG